MFLGAVRCPDHLLFHFASRPDLRHWPYVPPDPLHHPI